MICTCNATLRWYQISGRFLVRQLATLRYAGDVNAVDNFTERLYNQSGLWSLCKVALEQGSSQKARNFLPNYIKLCATSVVLEAPEKRVHLAWSILDLSLQAGVALETSFFNTLLNVYSFNHHFFSPFNFLFFMTKHQCQPDLVTYSRLVIACCSHGNIPAAEKLVKKMQVNNMEIDARGQASFITAHARLNDIGEAEKLLETWKSEGHSALTEAYTNILQAYAERGWKAKIIQVYEEMRTAGLVADSQTLLEVINTLSRCGHVPLVSQLMEDFRTHLTDSLAVRLVCYSCLIRQEMEVPLILMKFLSRTDGFREILITCFIREAINSGYSVEETFNLLNELMDLSPYKFMVDTAISKVIYSETKRPQLIHMSNHFPHKDGLKLHPWGNRWVVEVRYALSLQGAQNLEIFHFCPLLAYHCSTANIAGLMETLYCIMSCEAQLTKEYILIRNCYIRKTFANAAISIEDYVSSQLQSQSVDQVTLRHLLMLQLTTHNFSSLKATLEKFNNVEEVWSEAAISYLLSRSKLVDMARPESVRVLETLLSHGAPRQLLPKNFRLADANMPLIAHQAKMNKNFNTSSDRQCRMQDGKKGVSGRNRDPGQALEAMDLKELEEIVELQDNDWSAEYDGTGSLHTGSEQLLEPLVENDSSGSKSSSRCLRFKTLQCILDEQDTAAEVFRFGDC